MTPKVSIGIVTKSREETLRRLLASIQQQTCTPDELLIVDDSVGQRVESSVLPEFDFDGVKIKYHDGTTTETIQEARNIIIRESTGDIICFVDDDVVCKPGWLEAVLEEFQSTAVGAVGGPAITTDEDLEVIPDVSRTEDPQNQFGEHGEIFMASDRWVPPEPVQVDLLMGANMSFRADVFAEIGGFDVGYKGTAQHEDSDVFARLRDTEYDVLYRPDAFVYHLRADTGGSRSEKSRRQWYYWLGRNTIRFKYHNYRDQFGRSLFATLFTNRGISASLQEQLLGAIRTDDTTQLYWTRGYIAGLLMETVFSSREDVAQ